MGFCLLPSSFLGKACPLSGRHEPSLLSSIIFVSDTIEFCVGYSSNFESTIEG